MVPTHQYPSDCHNQLSLFMPRIKTRAKQLVVVALVVALRVAKSWYHNTNATDKGYHFFQKYKTIDYGPLPLSCSSYHNISCFPPPPHCKCLSEKLIKYSVKQPPL